MKSVYDIVNELRSTGSRNEKIAILQENKDHPHLKGFFQYALDEMKVFGIKKIPEYEERNETSNGLVDAFILLDSLQAREFTGNDAVEMLSEMLSSLPSDDAEILKLIVQKDPNCGVNHSTVNKVWGKGTVPKFDVMLCAGKNEKTLKKMDWPAIAQTKFDGMRVIFVVDPDRGIVTGHTRSGRVLDTFGLFDNELLALTNEIGNGTLVLDGELIDTVSSRKASNGILNKCLKGTATADMLESFMFYCWDFVPYENFKDGKWSISYKTRYSMLRDSDFSSRKDRVLVPNFEWINNPEHAEDAAKARYDAGEEGIILKNPNSGWEGKRVDHHIKYKAELEIDLEVIGVHEGTGKYRGQLGHITCRTNDGGLVTGVGSGFSDEERDKYYTENIVGSIVAVKYNEVIEKKDEDVKSLFLPIFVEIRSDKSEADSTP